MDDRKIPERLQPRGSLDEKSSLELTDEKENKHSVDSVRPESKETMQTKTSDTIATEALPYAAEAKQENDWEYITGIKLVLVITAVTLACFLMLLDNSIVATAIPRITNEFNSLDDIGWYGSAYLIASCAFQPSAGKLYSQFSSKYCFMAFVFIFEIGSAVCGAAQSSNMLIIGRAVAGLGGSGIQNGALTIISACVPLEKRGLYIGMMMGFVQLGILLGPLIGGVLTQYATWRWCFYINLPIGGVALFFITFLHIPETRIKNTAKRTVRSLLVSLDVAGFCIFAPAAIQFLLALEWGGSKYAWNSSVVIGLFCGSAATLAVFLVWEHYRGDAAMIPLSMMRRRVVWSSCLTLFFVFANMLTTTYYLAIYFQAVKGRSPTNSGVDILPTVLSSIFTAVVAGILVGRVGYYLPFSIASSTLAAIGTGLISTLDTSSSTGQWVGYQLISGLGRGMGMQMPILAIQNNLDPKLSSVAMAIVVFFQTFGGALFLALDQTVFSTGLSSGLRKYAPGVDAAAVVKAGATGFRGIIHDPASLDGVLKAYSHAVSHVFYLASGTACAAFVFGWGMGWKSIKKPKPKKDAVDA